MDRQLGHVEVGDLLVEEPDQQPHQAALGLSLLAQKQHVVLGDQADVDLGDDRVVVADDAGKQLFARRQSIRRKLSWISCLTVLETQPLSRSSRSVAGWMLVVAISIRILLRGG